MVYLGSFVVCVINWTIFILTNIHETHSDKPADEITWEFPRIQNFFYGFDGTWSIRSL